MFCIILPSRNSFYAFEELGYPTLFIFNINQCPEVMWLSDSERVKGPLTNKRSTALSTDKPFQSRRQSLVVI